jgi:hypothetical protein
MRSGKDSLLAIDHSDIPPKPPLIFVLAPWGWKPSFLTQKSSQRSNLESDFGFLPWVVPAKPCYLKKLLTKYMPQCHHTPLENH